MDDIKDSHAASESASNTSPKDPDKPAEQNSKETGIGGLREVRPEDETRSGTAE